MPTLQVNGLSLYYESYGDGYPIVFCHEYASDYRGWEPQVSFFSRRYRCITFSCRGYPPSDVPQRLEDYSQDWLIADLRELMRALEIPQAHIVGFSMGGSLVLNFGIRHPEMCRSVVAIGAGAGTTNRDVFERDVAGVVELLASKGIEGFAEVYAEGPSRQPFKRKDQAGWAEFRRRLAEHSATGQSFTIRGVQLARPTLYALEKDFDQVQVPVLIVVGDEDEACLEPGLFLKRRIRSSGLAIVPQTGHAVNLEEPAILNDLMSGFFAMVEAGKWASREVKSTSLLP